MSYVEIITMGENIAESEFQQLSPTQKETFIREKLAQFHGDISESGLRELSVSLLHPEVLTWEALGTPSRLPPQRGTIISVSPDISGGIKKRNKFVRVDFTSSAPITSVPSAQFGMGAVEITKTGEIIIDCSKLESPKAGIQAMFPENTFVERKILSLL